MQTKLLLILLTVFSVQVYSQGGCSSCGNAKLTEYFLAALNTGDTAKTDLYLKSGINIKDGFCTKPSILSDEDYCTPFLFTAIRSANYRMIKYLIKKGADVNGPYMVPQIKSYPSPQDNMKTLRSTVGYKPNYPLMDALQPNLLNNRRIDIKVVKLLLDLGADPKFAVSLAQGTGDLSVMKLFADKGVKFNYTSKDLLKAIESNNSQAFDFYISAGVKADCPCFIAATKKGDIKKLDLFLSQGCNINCYNAFLYNPWHDIPEGVDPLKQFSALGWAVGNGDLKTVTFLVENGADLNARCIWHEGGLDPNGHNESLAEFSDSKHREGSKNHAVTEYLLLAPGIQKTKREENQNNILKYRSEAEAYLKQGKTTDATASFNKAYALSRDKKDQDGVVEYYRHFGYNSFYKTHNYDSAAYYFSEAYKWSTRSVDKYIYTESLYKSGKVDEAMKNCNELLSATDNNRKDLTYRLLGLCNEKLGKVDEAKLDYRKSLEVILEKDYYDKACLYSLLNENDNAIDNLNKAFKNGFKNFEALNDETDFDNISKSEAYTKLVNKYKKKLLK